MVSGIEKKQPQGWISRAVEFGHVCDAQLMRAGNRLDSFVFGPIYSRLPERSRVVSAAARISPAVYRQTGMNRIYHTYDPNRLQGGLETKIPETIEEGKVALSDYPTRPNRYRNLPGNCKEVPAEKIRKLYEISKSDPEFEALHTDEHGHVDFDRPLSPEKRMAVIKYITGIDLIDHEKTEGPEFWQRVRINITDEEIKTILRFYGEEPSQEEGWGMLIALARAGWEGTILLDPETGEPLNYITDNDDWSVDGFQVDWKQSFLSGQFAEKLVTNVVRFTVPPVAKLRPFQQIAHWAGRDIEKMLKPIREVGQFDVLTQFRPKPWEIMRVLRTGRTMSVRTDNYSRNLYRQALASPPKRFVETGLLPYQKPDFDRDYQNAERIYTSFENRIQIEKYLNHLKEKGSFAKLGRQSQDVISALMSVDKPYKAKIKGLENDPDSTSERFGKDRVFIDNSEQHTKVGHADMGANAIAGTDRHMAPLNNFFLSDPLFFLMTSLRDFAEGITADIQDVDTLVKRGLAALKIPVDREGSILANDVLRFAAQLGIDATALIGRLNYQPHHRYAEMLRVVFEDFKRIDEAGKDGLVYINHNHPDEEIEVNAAYKFLFGPHFNIEKARYLRVQRAATPMPFAEVFPGYEQPNEESKALIKQIRAELVKNGELEAARQHYRELVAENRRRRGWMLNNRGKWVRIKKGEDKPT